MGSERKEKIRSAHKVLGAYWLINVLRGKSPLKATLQTLVIEGNFLKRELLGQPGAANGSKLKQGAAKGGMLKLGSAKGKRGTAKGSMLKLGPAKGNKGKQGTVKGSAAKSGLLSQKAAAGSLKGRVLKGAVRKVLQKERVF